MPPTISVSILDLDFLDLPESFKKFEEMGIKNIHLDVIDTSFAENISFGPNIINRILELDFIFELHIMITNPLKILTKIRLERVNRITVHSEYMEIREYLDKLLSVQAAAKLELEKRSRTDVRIGSFIDNGIPIKNCRSSDIKLGIAINPDEKIPDFDEKNKPDHILLMTVYPGFGGQKFDENNIDKIHKLKMRNIEVGIDGGINVENASMVKDADYIVIGSALTKSENMVKYLDLLRTKI